MSNPDVTSNQDVRTQSQPEGWFFRIFRGLAFLLFFALGSAAVAAVVLLPEYLTLARMEQQRDAVAHHLQCEQKLVAYNERTLKAIENDPVLTARLMIRHGNYRPAGARELDVPLSAQPSVAARLLNESQNPPPMRQDRFTGLARWVDDPFTSLAVLLLGLGMLVVCVFLAAPQRQTA